MPDPAQSGISNFFENLSMPVRAVSSILQGKGDRAAKEVGAFLLDSTVGIAGIRRPSEDVFGEEIPPEDFGQTLGAWGVSSGPYLVLPLLGPSTLRDFAGDLGDFVLDPVYYVEDWEIRWGARGTEFINALPERIELYEELDDAAVDPYIALRNAYLQNRRRAVEN
jgi:phospholipid-binding lipoprotein MlaA